MVELRFVYKSRGMLAVVLVALALGHAVHGAIPSDEVTVLPGWSGALPSKVYSGYVSAGRCVLVCNWPDRLTGFTTSDNGYDMFEHYAFIESENNPATDPVIVWSNGGPGASSFFGLMIELGPFYLSEASLQTAAYNASGVPTLFLNAFRWSKVGYGWMVFVPNGIADPRVLPSLQDG